MQAILRYVESRITTCNSYNPIPQHLAGSPKLREKPEVCGIYMSAKSQVIELFYSPFYLLEMSNWLGRISAIGTDAGTISHLWLLAMGHVALVMGYKCLYVLYVYVLFAL